MTRFCVCSPSHSLRISPTYAPHKVYFICCTQAFSLYTRFFLCLLWWFNRAEEQSLTQIDVALRYCIWGVTILGQFSSSMKLDSGHRASIWNARTETKEKSMGGGSDGTGQTERFNMWSRWRSKLAAETHEAPSVCSLVYDASSSPQYNTEYGCTWNQCIKAHAGRLYLCGCKV